MQGKVWLQCLGQPKNEKCSVKPDQCRQQEWKAGTSRQGSPVAEEASWHHQPKSMQFPAYCRQRSGRGVHPKAANSWLVGWTSGIHSSTIQTILLLLHFFGLTWGSVKIPCWPACLESLGHRSGWGPHRFTWFGYMVLISVLICKGIPLSWSRSDLVSAWHLGGLRCPWPPSSNASPQRWSSTAQKKKLTAHTPANPPAPFFWKGRATVVCFSFYISSSFHIYSRINLAQWFSADG